MDSFYGIPNEPIQYYDRKEKTCYYCKECGEIIPLSRKGIGVCEDCEEIIKPFEEKQQELEEKKKQAIENKRKFIAG